MQQAYQALRVISEAQTVHIVLATLPGELMLTELRAASEALQEKSSDGIKAVILDFADQLVALAEASRRPAPEPPPWTWRDAAAATWDVYAEAANAPERWRGARRRRSAAGVETD